MLLLKVTALAVYLSHQRKSTSGAITPKTNDYQVGPKLWANYNYRARGLLKSEGCSDGQEVDIRFIKLKGFVLCA